MANYGKIQLLGNALSDKDAAKGRRHTISKQLDDGRIVKLDKFDSEEDFQFALTLKDENGNCVYEKDASFRMTVQELVANSPALFNQPTLARRSPIPTNEEFLKALKVDALRQTREQLTDAAGGKDAIAKYNAALAMTNPEFAVEAQEMLDATEVATPYADMLRARKQSGQGPLTWTFAVDAATAIAPAGENITDDIITVDTE